MAGCNTPEENAADLKHEEESEKEYTCEWVITVSAKSPQEAVNIARSIQLDPGNDANHFTVFDDLDTGDSLGEFNADL